MCQIDGISTGKLHDFQPGEGTGRPAAAELERLGLLHRNPEHTYLDDYDEVWIGLRYDLARRGDDGWHVYRKGNWVTNVHTPALALALIADGLGQPPASPVPPTPTPCPYIVTGGEGTSHCSLAERSAMHAAVPPTRPGADAVIRALIAACPSYGRGEGDTFHIEESAVVRMAREFLAAAPPTPTPQADGTGQALKSMAIELAVERRRASLATVALLNACRDGWADGDSAAAKYLAEAELAAAPPSTPAEQPQPDEQTVTIDEATAAWPLGMATAEQLAASKEKRPDADL